MKMNAGIDSGTGQQDGPQDGPSVSGTSARILEAASGLLAASGYEALSMRKVARAVGISQAAIYRHYADKADLVAAVVESGYRILSDTMEALAGAAGTPSELLAAGIHAYVAFAGEHAGLFRAVLLQDIGPSQERVNVLSRGVAGQRRTFGLLAGLIARGVARGEFAPCDPEVSAQAVWAAMFGLAARMALERPDEGAADRRRAIVDRQAQILIRGLRGEKEKS